MEKRAVVGHIAALSSILIWGVTFVQTKILLEYLSPVEILIFRFAIALLILYAMHPKRYRPSVSDELKFIGLGFSGIFLYYILENVSLEYTQAANVGLLVSTSPLLTAILAHFFLKNEKLSLNLFIGFFMAITGIFIMVFNKLGGISVGDMLAFLGALSFGVYSVLLRNINSRYHYLYVTQKSFLYGLIFMVIYAFLTHSRFHINVLGKPVVLFNLLFLAIFASGVCFVLWRIAVESIGSVATSNYIYLIPLLNAAAAVVVLNEKITTTLTVAGFLILGGLFVSQKSSFFKQVQKHETV